jgi:hypothetical protein
MKTTTKLWMLGSIILISLNACKKDEPAAMTNPPASTGAGTAGLYESGIFITNEGQFPSGAGTVSFYNRTTKTVSNDIFQKVNGYPLGSVVQSMNLYNGKAYIVVNTANKVEVVTAGDFKSAGSITGFTQPRYFLPINASKAYVSEWGDGGSKGAVRVINLANNTISNSIPTGLGAENMVKYNDFVYVTCNGGFGKDSIVTVINAVKDTVFKKIVVGPNPGYIQMDANGKIWVLCKGQYNTVTYAIEKAGKLVRINPANNTVEQTFAFSTASSPDNLSLNAAKTKLFYNFNGAVYAQDITAGTLSATPLINKRFYGLGIDPVTDNIFGADPKDYTNAGYVFRYTPAGVAIDSLKVGVVPGGFFFK